MSIMPANSLVAPEQYGSYFKPSSPSVLGSAAASVISTATSKGGAPGHSDVSTNSYVPGSRSTDVRKNAEWSSNVSTSSASTLPPASVKLRAEGSIAA
jgi:hypothetical protein